MPRPDIHVWYISDDTGVPVKKKVKALLSVGALCSFSTTREYIIPWHRIRSVEGPTNFTILNPIRD